MEGEVKFEEAEIDINDHHVATFQENDETDLEQTSP